MKVMTKVPSNEEIEAIEIFALNLQLARAVSVARPPEPARTQRREHVSVAAGALLSR